MLDYLDLFRAHSNADTRKGSFTALAGLRREEVPPESITHQRRAGNASVVQYSFPRGFSSPHHDQIVLCGDNDGGVVDLSAVLAVFDECSTWALFGVDRC